MVVHAIRTKLLIEVVDECAIPNLYFFKCSLKICKTFNFAHFTLNN